MLRRGGTGTQTNNISGNGGIDGQRHHEEHSYSTWQHSEDIDDHHQEQNLDVDSYFSNLFTGDSSAHDGARSGGHQGLIGVDHRASDSGASTPTNFGFDSISYSNQGIMDSKNTSLQQQHEQQLQHEHHKSNLHPIHQATGKFTSGYNEHSSPSGYSEDNFVGGEGGWVGKQVASPYGSPTAVNQRVMHSLPLETTGNYGNGTYHQGATATPSGHYENDYHVSMQHEGGRGTIPFPPQPPTLQHHPQQGPWNGQYGVQQQHHQQQQLYRSSPYPPPPSWTTIVTEPLLKARALANSFLSGLGTQSSNFLGAHSNAGYYKKQDDGDAMMPPGTSTISETLASDNWMSGLLTPPNHTPPHSSNVHPHHSQSSSTSQELYNLGSMLRRSNDPPLEQKRREGLAMVGLVLLLFVGMNLGSLMKVEQNALANMRERRNRWRGKNNGPLLHEEGMDRPNSLAYLKQVRGRGWGGAKATSSSGAQVTSQMKQSWGASRLGRNSQQQQQQQRPQQQAPHVSATRQASQIPPQKQQMPPPQPPANNFALEQLMSKATPDKPPQTPPPPSITNNGPILPTVFSNVATVGKEFPPYNSATDIPMFWHIPKAGGSSLKEVFGMCMGLTLGCELGADPQHASAQLETFDIAQRTVVNIDFYNPQGIEKARSLNVASSGKVDLMVSPYLQESATLFTPNNQGRMFTMLRHPIDRAISSYGWYLQQEQKTHPGAPPLSLVDYAKSNRIENNWMTRFLSGKMSGPLTDGDFNMAKQILKTKFIIGLFDQREEFLQRLNLYFGWSAPNSPSQQKSKLNPTERHKCIQQHMAQASPSNRFTQHSPVQKVEEGSKEYVLLTRQNNFDMQLYEFATKLFKEQRSLFI